MADTDGGGFLNDLVAKAKEVGEQVKEFAEDAFDNVKEFTGDAVEKGQEVFEGIKDKFDGDDAGDAVQDAGDAVKDAAGDVADAADDAKDAAADVAEDVEKGVDEAQN